MEIGWNLMFSDKRSGDVLVSKLLVSHGRPRKPAFFYYYTHRLRRQRRSGQPFGKSSADWAADSPRWEGIPTRKVTTSSFSSLRNSSFFPLLMLVHFHVPGRCLPCAHPEDGARSGNKVFSAAAASHHRPKRCLRRRKQLPVAFPPFLGSVAL